MARKIPKASQGVRSMSVLFVELLIPWMIMAVAALLLVSAGVSGIVAFSIALGTGLAVTLLIGAYEKKRRINVARSLARRKVR